MKKLVLTAFVCLVTTPIFGGVNGSHPPLKCGTPDIVMGYGGDGVMKIADNRIDTHPKTLLTSGGHFRIHYTESGSYAPDLTDNDANGVPDYIDSTAVYLEYAWDLIIGELGYRPPRSDNGAGGGDEIDVYIRDYGSTGYYGTTYPDAIEGTVSSAYMLLDNNYTDFIYPTKGYDALRVTTAHEFFHVVQFGYRTLSNQWLWWTEHTAVWMEERAWDDVNDYLYYLGYYYQNPTTPLDSNSALNSYDNRYMYGAALWAMYLADRYGDDIIRESWETFEEAASPGIDNFEAFLPDGLAPALNEFAVWNYFTRFRANPDFFFRDSDQFSYDVDIDFTKNSLPTADSLATNRLTSRYVEVIIDGSWEENRGLDMNIQPRNGGSYATTVILFNDPNDYHIAPMQSDRELIPLDKDYERAVMVTTCVNTSGTSYRYRFDADFGLCTGIDAVEPLAFSVGGAYPNPFNPATTLAFTLPEAGNVRVDVYNTAGQQVDNLHDGFFPAGEQRIHWRPDTLAGGVYFFRIQTDNHVGAVKTLYLK